MKQVDPIDGQPAENVAGDAESRLSRWSRRKQASREVEKNPGSPVAAAVVESESDEQALHALTDKDMPPLEMLTEESDYTGFLSPKVSDELRKLALRKLFHSSRFNICDGLDDYDEDFTKFAKLGDIITADMRRLAEQEALKKLQQQGETESQVVESVSASEAPEGVDAPIEAPTSVEGMAEVENVSEIKTET